MVSIGYTLFPRFFFFAMGFGVIIVIRGAMRSGIVIGKLLRLPRLDTGWSGTALCAGLIMASMLSVPFSFGPKQDYVSALNLIEHEKQMGDAVVTVGIAKYPYGEFYKTDWESVGTLQDLERVRDNNKRTWVVYTMPAQSKEAYPEIFAAIEREFTIVGEFYGTLNGGAVIVCRVDA